MAMRMTRNASQSSGSVGLSSTIVPPFSPHAFRDNSYFCKWLVAGWVALTVLAASPAAAQPKPWMWSVAKANRLVVWNNPQVGPRGHQTTALKANCAGVPPFVKAAGVKLFHVFRCGITFRDEDTGRVWTPAEFQAETGMPNLPVYKMCSSKTDPNRVLRYGLGIPGCP